MTFDALQRTALTSHDISASATASAVGIALGRTGLVEGLTCSVSVGESDVSAVAFPNPIRCYFEYTTDGGSTWRRGGAGTILNPATKRIISFPVGFADIVPEQNTDANIQWRVTMDITAVIASADDYDFRGYLSGPTNFVAGPID
jgi:hypothetical protein